MPAEQHEALSPYASPMLADDLSGLAPAHILTAEFHSLRAENLVEALRTVLELHTASVA